MRNVTRGAWATVGLAAVCFAALVPLWAQGQGRGNGRDGVNADAARSNKPVAINHKATQAAPIQLGTSGGNATDIANGYCCSGTLGSLVQDGSGNQYILSNSHVFAQDIAGPNVAEVGDPINQAGLVDTQCVDDHQYVAHLSSLSSLNPGGISAVDAAVAAVVAGQVRTDGAILEIGTISASPVDATVNQAVKKSGRTSGLTRSHVQALHAQISVAYTNECGGSQFTSTYQNQVVIANRGQTFLIAGDSGSLMVEDVNNSPRAVGLLFAGSSSIAVANPIHDVLTHFNVFMVGSGVPSQSLMTEDNATKHANDVRQRYATRLVDIPGSVGHAVGVSDSGGDPVIKVYVSHADDRSRRSMPTDLEGVKVEVEEVGDVVAMAKLPCPKRR